MTSTPLTVAVIIGSTRAGRFGPTVAHWFAEEARQAGRLRIDVIDLAESPLPVAMTPEPDDATAATLARLTPRLASADAFVVVTPEYNHSYPASVKNLIDWHYTQWRAKPVGFVSYGGLSGGLRAVEHLRPVFAELHAVTIRETVSFHRAREQFDADGNPKDAEATTAAATALLNQLEWWADALRRARDRRPYTD